VNSDKKNTDPKSESNRDRKEPNHTPGQAEGDEKTVDKALKSEGNKQQK